MVLGLFFSLPYNEVAMVTVFKSPSFQKKYEMTDRLGLQHHADGPTNGSPYDTSGGVHLDARTTERNQAHKEATKDQGGGCGWMWMWVHSTLAASGQQPASAQAMLLIPFDEW